MESFEEHYASMCDAIKKHLPGADMALIDRAVDYANQKHKLQKRKDGSPYNHPPLAVARSWQRWGWTATPFWAPAPRLHRGHRRLP